MRTLSWINPLQRNFFRLKSFFKRHFGRAPAQVVPRRKNHALTPEKQAQLQKLCEQLFKKKSLITSGKLQLIGLESVKKRLGKQWAGLAAIVYEITENAIRKHQDKGDIFLRYRDNTYAIIFAYANLETAREKAAAIAEDIRTELFALDEKDLKSLEIREAIKQISADFSAGGFPDFLDTLTEGWQNDYDWADGELAPEKDADADESDDPVNSTMVNTTSSRARIATQARAFNVDDLACHYQPLWDVSRNALTSYFCLIYNKKLDEDMQGLERHKSLYSGQPAEKILDLDMFVLSRVTDELAAMEKDGRKLLIVCPVQYRTLFHFDNYEAYKARLERIPDTHKQFLVFYVMGTPKNLPSKDPFWFGLPMQPFCRQLIVELPLGREANFDLVRTAGIKSVSLTLGQNALDEEETIKLLNFSSTRAAAAKITSLAVMEIGTLSLTTSAICAGYGLLGGPAIHGIVQAPDTVHRYHHEDLIKALTAKAS
jgi:hypothetical protein